MKFVIETAMGKKHHNNTIRRMRLVCEIVKEHYEPGDQRRSYYQVWKLFVNPVYPMCYHTMLRYISTPLPKEEETEKEDPNQLSLDL